MKNSNHGYVYILHLTENIFKIGRTVNMKGRIKEIGILLPVEPTLVHWSEHDDYVWVERFFHEKFATQRMRGEWFRLSPADLKWIIWQTGPTPDEEDDFLGTDDQWNVALQQAAEVIKERKAHIQ